MLLALVKRPPYSNLEHSRELVYSLEVQGIKARLVHDVADVRRREVHAKARKKPVLHLDEERVVRVLLPPRIHPTLP